MIKDIVKKALVCLSSNLGKGRTSVPHDFTAEYDENLLELRKNPRGFKIVRAMRYDVGGHPSDFMDYECAYASRQISGLNPKTVLDIGSYRHFIIGMLSHYKVATVDIRHREPLSENETVITCDAKSLKVNNDEYDVVVSLCSLEHFGLGRYGDEFDLDADKKALGEMVRVLRPNGHLVFTTAITGAHPLIAFNAHRIYNYAMIHDYCGGMGLRCEHETFYSHKLGGYCLQSYLTKVPEDWDVYCGCWKKSEIKDG